MALSLAPHVSTALAHPAKKSKGGADSITEGESCLQCCFLSLSFTETQWLCGWGGDGKSAPCWELRGGACVCTSVSPRHM